MDGIIRFFQETLSGTTYIIVVIVAVVLIFACIGYLAERSMYLKKKASQYAKAQNEDTPVIPEVKPVENTPMAATIPQVTEAVQPVPEVAIPEIKTAPVTPQVPAQKTIEETETL